MTQMRFDGRELSRSELAIGMSQPRENQWNEGSDLRPRAPHAELLEASDEPVHRGLVCRFAALRRFGHRCFRLERV